MKRCQYSKWMLPGHTDEVTSIDASRHVPGLLATVAEDHQLRLWRFSSENVSEPMGLSSVSFPSDADNNMRPPSLALETEVVAVGHPAYDPRVHTATLKERNES